MYAEWYDLIFSLTKSTFNKKKREKTENKYDEKQVIFYQAYGNKVINPYANPMRQKRNLQLSGQI